MNFFPKKFAGIKKTHYLCTRKLGQHPSCNDVTHLRRDGRVVDYSGLENRRAERHRGFESLSLRKQIRASFTGALILFSNSIG